MEKKKLKNYKKERKELEKNSKVLETLKKLFVLNKENKSKRNNNLIKLVASEDLLFTAYEKLKKNKGSMTEGTEPDTPDEKSLQDIKNISHQILKGTFKWTPIKKVMIPKPGKKEERPLGIPNFKDRLVQETIRMVLEIIYEPIFQTIECNHGFRPSRSTETAMIKLQQESKECTWALEGDIKSAYPSVNHVKLINILKKKITDKKFLKLVKEGLEHNIVFKDNVEKNLIGTPQGGIASPILFNIYMHEFDIFALETIENYTTKINWEEQRKKATVLPRHYRRIKSRLEKSKARIEAKKKKDYGKLTLPEQRQIIKDRRIMRKSKSEMLNIRSSCDNKAWIRMCYIRYADDWILISNTTEEILKEIKELFSTWLERNLDFTLDEKKTNITNLRKSKAKFLGFTIFHKKKRIIRKESETGKIFRQRSTVPLTLGIDHERVRDRLIAGSIITKDLKPRSNLHYLVLTPTKMIEKYKQRLEGLVNYYHSLITYPTELNFYYYAYKFSCLKTLSRRLKKSGKQITLKHGPELKFQSEVTEMTLKGKKPRTISASFPTYRQMSKRARQLSEKKWAIIYKQMKANKKKIIGTEIGPEQCISHRWTKNDPFSMDSIAINLRSQYQLKTACAICGCIATSENPIEMHHVKHIRKKKITGFKMVMKSLNRKTIPCCKSCHISIHRGTYDTFNLKDIYNVEITQI